MIIGTPVILIGIVGIVFVSINSIKQFNEGNPINPHTINELLDFAYNCYSMNGNVTVDYHNIGNFKQFNCKYGDSSIYQLNQSENKN